MRKFIALLVMISIIIGVVWKFFIYIDLFEDCYITIHPSWLEFSNTSMKNAIKVLKHASPNDYKEICENVRTINPNISCGGFGGGCFYSDSPQTIDISTTNRSLALTATVLVHETCHSIQNKEKRGISEPECDEKMAEALSRIVEY